jgi:myo-inositol-1(or 4)-monophosphatase
VASDELTKRRDLAIELAKRAGSILIWSEAAVDGVEEKSSRTDVVTVVDRSAEQMIVSGIVEAFPDDGVWGEEGGDKASHSGYVWIIDPLDGTANYVRGLRTSVVSIAIAKDDVIVAGVVFDPYAGEAFVGVKGSGATCNGITLNSSNSDKGLAESFVGLSGSNREQPRRVRADLLNRLVIEADSVRDLGSTALSLCWTAAGRFDAHVGIDVQWWDFAAGVIIAREAGCEITGIDGAKDPIPQGFVVANPSLMESLAKIATESGLPVTAI